MKACIALVLALAVGALGACGEDPTASPPSDSEPLVVWERGGGIAGVAERLVIEADGSATLTVGIDGRRRAVELTRRELDEVRGRVEAAELEAVNPPPEDAICADCFSYEIVAGVRSATWDSSVELPDTVDSLAALLSELAAEHYPKGADRIESMA